MRTKRRSGFTLVEMLVVVAIIGILAAILVPAVFYALSQGENAGIAVELANIGAALQQYKSNVHGQEYPPNFDNAARVTAHIQRKFGKYNPMVGTAPPTGLDAAEALVFWLQGYNSSNPTNPLSGPRTPLFSFDESRLVPTRTVGAFQLYHYYPRGGQNVPYAYIRFDSYGTFVAPANGPNNGTGTLKPYKSDIAPNGFLNPNSFQLISAGQDGDWGANSADKRFPSGLNYNDGDRDNLANFSEGRSLGDAQE